MTSKLDKLIANSKLVISEYLPKGWQEPLKIKQLNVSQVDESEDVLRSGSGKLTAEIMSKYKKKLVELSIVDDEGKNLYEQDKDKFDLWFNNTQAGIINNLIDKIKEVNFFNEEQIEEEKKS